MKGNVVVCCGILLSLIFIGFITLILFFISPLGAGHLGGSSECGSFFLDDADDSYVNAVHDGSNVFASAFVASDSYVYDPHMVSSGFATIEKQSAYDHSLHSHFIPTPAVAAAHVEHVQVHARTSNIADEDKSAGFVSNIASTFLKGEGSLIFFIVGIVLPTLVFMGSCMCGVARRLRKRFLARRAAKAAVETACGNDDDKKEEPVCASANVVVTHPCGPLPVQSVEAVAVASSSSS